MKTSFFDVSVTQNVQNLNFGVHFQKGAVRVLEHMEHSGIDFSIVQACYFMYLHVRRWDILFISDILTVKDGEKSK